MCQQVFAVAGLMWGDESKGLTVACLVEHHGAGLVVRYNGGPQCSHNVIDKPTGRHHAFSQFGSGMFSQHLQRTFLSRFMLVDPLAQINEAAALIKKRMNPWDGLRVDNRCVIVTPFHQAINRLKELARGQAAHGSVGIGVGESRFDSLEFGERALLAGDIPDEAKTRKKLRFLWELAQAKLETLLQQQDPGFAWTEDAKDQLFVLSEPGPMIDQLIRRYSQWPATLVDEDWFRQYGLQYHSMVFEGAQGVLLDETHGQAPHTTWTNTTFHNAFTLLHEANYRDSITKIGCIRTYSTRHGHGPFPTEVPRLIEDLPELHNQGDRFTGPFRVGLFDWERARHAIDIVDGVDEISLSHLDRLTYLPQAELETIEWTEKALHAPVTITGHGPTIQDRIHRHSSYVKRALEPAREELWTKR